MKKLPFIDMHQDLRMHVEKLYPYPHARHVQTSFKMLEDMEAKVVFVSGFAWPPDERHYDPIVNDLITEDFKYYHHICEKNKKWSIIDTGKDVIDVFKKEGKHAMLLHIEGLNAFTGTNEDWHMVEKWYGMGVRSLGIVWNLPNNLGGGADDNNEGLTELGREFISWCQDKRIVIDLAHMNEKTFFDVASMLSQPLVVSHGNVRALCDRSRNYTDEQLVRIAESGGVIGLFMSPGFVSSKEGVVIDDVVRHVDYIRDLVGIDHIALGSDFGGIVSTGFIEKLSSVREVPNLWRVLKKAGYSEEDIEKIAWKNGMRVLTEILK